MFEKPRKLKCPWPELVAESELAGTRWLLATPGCDLISHSVLHFSPACVAGGLPPSAPQATHTTGQGQRGNPVAHDTKASGVCTFFVDVIFKCYFYLTLNMNSALVLGARAVPSRFLVPPPRPKQTSARLGEGWWTPSVFSSCSRDFQPVSLTSW